MKIQHITNQNFNGRLCGDYKTIIEISKKAGLKPDAVDMCLRKLNRIVPDENDRVFLFFRNIDQYDDYKLRSQIEVLKEGDPFGLKALRTNIYPFNTSRKDLLSKMVEGVEDVLKGKSDDTEIRPMFFVRNWHWPRNIMPQLSTKRVNFDEKGVQILSLLSK